MAPVSTKFRECGPARAKTAPLREQQKVEKEDYRKRH